MSEEINLRDTIAINSPDFFDEAKHIVCFRKEDLSIRRFCALPEKVQIEVLKKLAELKYAYADAMLGARK